MPGQCNSGIELLQTTIREPRRPGWGYTLRVENGAVIGVEETVHLRGLIAGMRHDEIQEHIKILEPNG